MSFEEKARVRQELVILLALTALQSFDGLHKVDDRDGSNWLCGSVTRLLHDPLRIPVTTV